jgi:hypothetical protein
MKPSVTAVALVIAAGVLTSSQALSEPRLLKGHEFAVYHACLYESWVHDWCRVHDVAYVQCLVSYGGGKFTPDGGLFSDNYCYRMARGLKP